MKKTILILILAICATGKLWAFDFSYTYSGKTLYYTITSTSPRTVEVDHCPDYISGTVIIPSSVTYSGNSYSVTSIGNVAF